MSGPEILGLKHQIGEQRNRKALVGDCCPSYLTRVRPGEADVCFGVSQHGAADVDVLTSSHKLWRDFQASKRRPPGNCRQAFTLKLHTHSTEYNTSPHTGKPNYQFASETSPLTAPHLPHTAAGTWWRPEGFPSKQPCSRTPPDDLGWVAAARIPGWGRRSPESRWLGSPPVGPPGAETPLLWVRSLDRVRRRASQDAGTRSQSGWPTARRCCLCLVRETTVEEKNISGV